MFSWPLPLALTPQSTSPEWIAQRAMEWFSGAYPSSILLLAAIQPGLILCFWLLSLLFPGMENRPKKAVQLWASYALGILASLGLLAGGIYLSSRVDSGGIYFASVVVGVLGVVATLFYAPVAVYQATIGQSSAFLAGVASLTVTAYWVACLLGGKPVRIDLRERAGEQLEHLRSLAASSQPVSKALPDEHVMADRARPIPERKAAAERIRQRLEQARANLPRNGDPEFSRAEARYKEQARTLQADSDSAAAQQK